MHIKEDAVMIWEDTVWGFYPYTKMSVDALMEKYLKSSANAKNQYYDIKYLKRLIVS